MAPGRKHASFRLRSQSDNGVIIELTPLSVCGCISLRLTLSGAALTSFLMPASAVHQLGCKGGARGSPWPSAHASCSPDVCACGIFMVRLVSVAFLVWGVKLAFLHCVVLLEGKVGAAVSGLSSRSSKGHPPLPPPTPASWKSQGLFLLCRLYLRMGAGDWEFHIFSPRNCKTVESCAACLNF